VNVNIIVCVKTNPDLQMIRIKNREPILEAIPYKVGDLEKNALEAAIRLREAAGGGKITALTVAEGDRKARETIKEALAMGADDAAIVDATGLSDAGQGAVAQALAAAIRKIGAYDLLLFGEGSTDNYSGQVGPRVAEILGLPQIGYARKITLTDGGVECERSMDDMLETLAAPMPVAITVVSEINEPRIPSLMNIMKAKNKPVQEWTLPDLDLDQTRLAAQREIVSNLAEEQDRKRVILEGSPAEQADSLINAFTKEGVLGR